MAKLSEKLANASVKDAPKLLIKLAVLIWGDDQDNHDDDYLKKWITYKTLVDIGIQGWLSAVMMLVPESYSIATHRRATKCITPRGLAYVVFNENDSCEAGAIDPSLALASVMAEIKEKKIISDYQENTGWYMMIIKKGKQ